MSYTWFFPQPTSANRWHEKAGLRRDALSSQVIDALAAQEIRRPAMVNLNPDRARSISHVFLRLFLRPESLIMSGCGRPSRLKMNSLRSVLTAASPDNNHLISGPRETSAHKLTQPQNALIPTGLLMEGQYAHRAVEINCVSITGWLRHRLG
jgi:hypothetical protein